MTNANELKNALIKKGLIEPSRKLLHHELELLVQIIKKESDLKLFEEVLGQYRNYAFTYIISKFKNELRAKRDTSMFTVDNISTLISKSNITGLHNLLQEIWLDKFDILDVMEFISIIKENEISIDWFLEYNKSHPNRYFRNAILDAKVEMSDSNGTFFISDSNGDFACSIGIDDNMWECVSYTHLGQAIRGYCTMYQAQHKIALMQEINALARFDIAWEAKRIPKPSKIFNKDAQIKVITKEMVIGTKTKNRKAISDIEKKYSLRKVVVAV